SLQLGDRAVLPAMVRQLVVRKHRARKDVAPHQREASTWSAPSLAASSGVFPCCRATMYAAYHPDQWCLGAIGSYLPWCSSVSRRSAVRVATSKLLRPRPGKRVVISWSRNVLPSGSLNEA